MGVAVAAAGRASGSGEALSLAAQRLSSLAGEAAKLDERAAALAEREGELQALAAALAEEQIRLIARATELGEAERAAERLSAALAEQQSIVAAREAVVAELQEEVLEQARALEKRAARFHWRWFLRVWAWRPRLGGAGARVCELFFVPSPSGYRLLEQTGVAVSRNARITGLLDERATYVVTKLAQLPFDGRWCAYLEIDELRGGDGND
jgi:hypothetical protein